MKQISTLFLAFLCSLTSKTHAQNVNQGFETQDEINLLAASCWTFNNFTYTATTPAVGNGSIQSQVGTLGEVITPVLSIPSSLTISFSYKVMQTINGEKKIQIYLLNGATKTKIESFNMGNSSSTVAWSKTFTSANTPGANVGGTQKIVIETSANSSVQIDALTINAPYANAGGCPPENITLPVTLVSFSGNITADQSKLTWKVADNEEARQFDVEKSFDGKNFSSAGIVLSSNKIGEEEYTFTEKVAASRISYRLKMVDKDGKVNYSRIISLSTQNAQQANKSLSLMGNPVTSNLVLSYHSYKTSPVCIQIFNEAGALLYSRKQQSNTGVNQFIIDGTQLNKGTYFVQVVNEMSEKSMVKAVKL